MSVLKLYINDFFLMKIAPVRCEDFSQMQFPKSSHKLGLVKQHLLHGMVYISQFCMTSLSNTWPPFYYQPGLQQGDQIFTVTVTVAHRACCQLQSHGTSPIEICVPHHMHIYETTKRHPSAVLSWRLWEGRASVCPHLDTIQYCASIFHFNKFCQFENNYFLHVATRTYMAISCDFPQHRRNVVVMKLVFNVFFRRINPINNIGFSQDQNR